MHAEHTLASPDSWRRLPAAQQPDRPGPEAPRGVVAEYRRLNRYQSLDLAFQVAELHRGRSTTVHQAARPRIASAA